MSRNLEKRSNMEREETVLGKNIGLGELFISISFKELRLICSFLKAQVLFVQLSVDYL